MDDWVVLCTRHLSIVVLYQRSGTSQHALVMIHRTVSMSSVSTPHSTTLLVESIWRGTSMIAVIPVSPEWCPSCDHVINDATTSHCQGHSYQ